jgi:PEP-CTERM motif
MSLFLPLFASIVIKAISAGLIRSGRQMEDRPPRPKSIRGGSVMKLKRNAIRGFGAFAASALVGATLAASAANAAVTNITSSSTILDVALNIASFGPELPAAGSAPPLYNVNNSLASFSGAVGPLSITSGALVDTASGDIATASGTASSTLATFNISADSIFTVAATALSSTSSVDGTPSATGFTTLADLTITVLGSSLTIPLNPTPNDVILNAGGITITLNQQIPEVGGVGITTNAIAIDFNNFLGVVTGSIDIAQSAASITGSAVPEPSTWAMMALGFVGLAFAYRRGRKVAAIA